MEHPFLSVTEIKESNTIEEIQTKISDLLGRMSFAQRTGNGALTQQLQMVYEVYTRALTEMIEEAFSSSGRDHGDKIDIQ